MQDGKLNRRRFLGTAGAAAAAPLIIPSGVLAAPGQPGANDRLTIALIGCGGRGNSLIKEIRRSDVADYFHLDGCCDVDEKRLGSALQDHSKDHGPNIKPYRDYRYVLDRKDIDAVVIGTPDHWHAVQMVQACESGKHVYVEKPACCTIEEGKAMVAAQQKARVAIQVGSQGRSQPEAYMLHRYLVNGNIGKVSKVWAFHYESPSDTSPVADTDPPADLDYDLWLGPMRWRPYNRKYLPGSFRWMMESGGGQIRDRGAHVMSCAMWWMGADGTGPAEIEATDVKFPTMGVYDVAIEMKVTYTFKNPDWTLIWDQKGRKTHPDQPMPQGRADVSRPGYGAVYHGDKGTMTHWGGDGGTWAEQKVLDWKLGPGDKDVYKSPGHFEDWYEGIKTGKKTIMNIEAAVGVANLTVLGNISAVLGRKLQWDQAKGEILGDEEARRMMSRPQRYPYIL
jgi:predicted dehydrogenase